MAATCVAARYRVRINDSYRVTEVKTGLGEIATVPVAGLIRSSAQIMVVRQLIMVRDTGFEPVTPTVSR